jgi:hypothetical protein
MRVYKITSEGREYFTDDRGDIAIAPVGSLVEVLEMTEEEYRAIPVTVESSNFFKLHG